MPSLASSYGSAQGKVGIHSPRIPGQGARAAGRAPAVYGDQQCSATQGSTDGDPRMLLGALARSEIIRERNEAETTSGLKLPTLQHIPVSAHRSRSAADRERRKLSCDVMEPVGGLRLGART
ncbi:hypothetical protein CF335_g9126 [Tilletia laevis]|nr:hypothetical protein CF335_g9126 [Tilletia laevis]